MARELALLTANVSGKVRHATRHGRPYLVAPMTLIVPGVLEGSRGKILYEPADVARDPEAWNGMPMVVRHPLAPDGRHLSARTPGVLESQGAGDVFGAGNSPTGNLAVEGWFDVEALRRVWADGLSKLQSGQPIELSTGLYLDTVPAPPGAVYNGRPYTHIARNYRPDHVALLPDGPGACSIKDGCGVFNCGGPGSGVPGPCPADAHDAGTKDGRKSIRERVTAAVTNLVKQLHTLELPAWALEHADVWVREEAMNASRPGGVLAVKIAAKAATKAYFAARKLLTGNADATPAEVEAVAEKLRAWMLDVAKETGWKVPTLAQLVEGLMKTKGGGMAGNAGPVTNDIAHDDIEDQLQDLLADRFGEERPMYPGGPTDCGIRIQDVFPDYVVWTDYDQDTWKLGYTVDAGTDLATLDPGEPVEVVRVTQYRPAAAEPAGNSRNQLRQRKRRTMALTAEQKKTIVGGLAANCNCPHAVPWKGKDEASLNGLSDDTLAAYGAWNAALAATPTPTTPHPVPTPTPAPAPHPTPAPVAPVARPLTDAEWVATAPPSVRGMVDNWQRHEQGLRTQMIDRLTSHIQTPEGKQTMTATYARMDTQTLETLAANALVPAAPPAPSYPGYYGAAGGPPAISVEKPGEPMKLPMWSDTLSAK